METEVILSKATGGLKEQGRKLSVALGCWSEHKTETAARDIARHGSKQSCHHQDLAPSCSEGFAQDNATKKVFSPHPQEGMSQEHAPAGGLELCTLPNQLKQPFT